MRLKVSYWTPQNFFFSKMFYYFFQHLWKISFEQIQYFYTNNALIFLQKLNFFCKAPKIPQAFFIFPKKSFRICISKSFMRPYFF